MCRSVRYQALSNNGSSDGEENNGNRGYFFLYNKAVRKMCEGVEPQIECAGNHFSSFPACAISLRLRLRRIVCVLIGDKQWEIKKNKIRYTRDGKRRSNFSGKALQKRSCV